MHTNAHMGSYVCVCMCVGGGGGGMCVLNYERDARETEMVTIFISEQIAVTH